MMGGGDGGFEPQQQMQQDGVAHTGEPSHRPDDTLISDAAWGPLSTIIASICGVIGIGIGAYVTIRQLRHGKYKK